MLDAGRARSLAVMAPERLSVFPNIPTLKEAMGSTSPPAHAQHRRAGRPPGRGEDGDGAGAEEGYNSKEYKDFMNARGFGLVYANAAGAAKTWPRPMRRWATR